MLHFATRGSGSRPVLLVHGFLGSGKNLGALARTWSGRRPDLRFVLPDLLGHGRSPPLPATARLADMADALVALLDELGLDDPVDIIGHSLGGRLALQTRLRHPNRLGRIALLDIRPGPVERSDTEQVVSVLAAAPARTDTREAMRAHLREAGLSRALVDWLLMSGDAGPDGFTWRVDRASLERFHAAHRAVDLWPAVASADDTLLVRGARSDYVDAADVAGFEQRGVPVVTVPEAGHFLHVERTEAVVDALDRFFAP